ncbi:MAG: CRTAC1 family protein [Acidimicrobiia bacterium]
MTVRRRRLVASVTLAGAVVFGATLANLPATARASAQTSERGAGRGDGDALTEVYRAPRRGPGGAPAFLDATSDLGLLEPLTGMRVHATATGDVNDDGWSDLFVGTFADRPEDDYRVRGADGPSPDRLLLGGSRGFRVDESFPAEWGRTAAAAFADLDGDGDLDLVLARNVRDVERGRAPSTILRNDRGRFVKAAELDHPRGARAIGLIDFDGDSRLDLVIVEDRFSDGASVLWRNEGKLRFVDATRTAGLPPDVAGMGVATADLNGDRAPDVLISGSNRLFLNQGDGSFREDDTARQTFDWPRFGDEDDPAGVVATDVDGDARTDLVIGQHYNSTVDEGRRVPVRLYLNDGNDGAQAPRFRDVTGAAGLTPLPTKAPHVDVVDLDADGRLDILTTASAGSVAVVFRQVGVDEGVPRFELTGIPNPPDYWVTAAVLDADRDGRLDVFLAEFEPTRPSPLLRNRTNAGHWFGVTATPGTVVELFHAGGLGDPHDRLAWREVGTSTGFAAGPSVTAWFGLGAVHRIDVRIVSPEGRTVVELHDAGVDRLVRLP